MPKTDRFSSSWFSKYFESLYLWIILAQMFLWLQDTWTARFLNNYNKAYWDTFFITDSWIFAFVSIFIAIIWQIKENRTQFNSAKLHSWLRGALRYYLAFSISLYGFAKILGTQFATSYATKDMLVGSLKGFALTWNYFGYSYTFAVILGLLQIGGSILLLFRRTTLLGVTILLPVMVNIVLINIFYTIAIGAFVNSLIFTFGLIYLLLLRWKDLKALFIATTDSDLPAIHLRFIKPVIKLLVIFAAFATIFSYISSNPSCVLVGKWKVEEFKRNGKIMDLNNWQTSTGVWNNIYIEKWGKLALSSNPYVFTNENAVWVDYEYDNKINHLKFSYPGLMVLHNEDIVISNYNGKSMQWNTVYSIGDTLQLKLSKVQ